MSDCEESVAWRLFSRICAYVFLAAVAYVCTDDAVAAAPARAFTAISEYTSLFTGPMLRMWSRALTAADLKDAPTDEANPL